MILIQLTTQMDLEFNLQQIHSDLSHSSSPTHLVRDPNPSKTATHSALIQPHPPLTQTHLPNNNSKPKTIISLVSPPLLHPNPITQTYSVSPIHQHLPPTQDLDLPHPQHHQGLLSHPRPPTNLDSKTMDNYLLSPPTSTWAMGNKTKTLTT